MSRSPPCRSPPTCCRARSICSSSRRCRASRCTAGASPNACCELSDDVLSVQQGSLYPALHRLEQQGWIKAEWKDTEHGRNAKFYTLTRDGRQQLERELDSWKRLSSAVGLLLKNA